nr:hypothetical protein [Tanacetum cinerariifolium]
MWTYHCQAWSKRKVNDVTRLQALVDKKKVVVTDAAIREVLWLDDTDGVDCLPNEEIFTELARMGYEKPSTKLTFYKAFFSSHSAMTSAIICLSTGREFNFSKYIFDSLGKDSLGLKHLYLRGYWSDKRLRKKEMQMNMLKMLLLVMMLKEMILLLKEKFLLLLKNHPYHLLPQLFHHHSHLKIYLQHLRYNKHHPNLLRRLEHLEYDKVAQALEITKLKRRVKRLEKENKARVLKLRRLQKVGTSQRVDTSDDTVMDDESNQGRMIDEMDKDDAVVLMDEKEEDKKVEEAKVDESAQVQRRQAKSQAEIYKIDMDHALKVLSMQEDEPAKVQEPQVSAATITAAPSRRRKGVVIRDPKEESTTSSIISTKTKSKDKGKGIMVEEPKPLKKKQQIKMDEEYAKKLHAELNEDIDWDVAINHVKLKAKEDPSTKEKMEEEENKALQSINETPTQKAAKRRKLNEEVEDLKRHLEIVPDEDDDVYIEATPLARKVPVVDYKIIELNNKPYYKIIRADGTHQLYINFLTLLKIFDREDLEALCSLVKERFSTLKPKNFSDDFLLTTLGAMFEKPDAQANV